MPQTLEKPSRRKCRRTQTTNLERENKIMKILPANSEGCWIFIFVIFLSFFCHLICHFFVIPVLWSHFLVIFLSFFCHFLVILFVIFCYFFGICLSFSWHFLYFLALFFTCFVVFLHQSNLVAVVQFMFFLRPCLNSFVFGLAACTVAFFQFS